MVFEAAAEMALSTLTGGGSGSPGTVSIPLYYQPLVDQQVIANISWGTPAKEPIPTVIDTGSYSLWVFGPNATVNSGSPYLGVLGPCNQTAEPFFDWPASTTHQGPFNISTTPTYGGAKFLTCNRAVNDTISFPGCPGFPSVPDIEVAICDFMLIKDRATTCDGAHYDKSILGLAPGTGTGGPYFRTNLEATGAVQPGSVYSLWYETLPEDINEPQHGHLLFGGAPSDAHVGDTATVKLVTPDSGIPGLYYVTLPEVLAGPVDGSGPAQPIPIATPAIPGPAPDCLVDTGTWGITLPTNETLFYAATGLEQDSPFSLPRYPAACADIPLNATIDLRFTGQNGKIATVKVPYRNLADAPGQKENTCRLNVQLANPDCTFGGTFFTAALTIFDDANKTVSFAQGKI